MSGFAGIVRIEPDAASAETDRAAIEAMARAIAFRGPDSLQQIRQLGASFAYSHLHTGTAPQESAQPFSVDGETWFLGDVRCDGREDIVRKLAQHGMDATLTASSEQLVLNTFAKFGEAGLAELEGDLSFVLWKPRERKILAFRDLTGTRPFFYSHNDGVLVFSNTMQAVLAVPSVSRELDEGFLADFLLGSPYHNPGSSVYRGIRRLPPGRVLEFSERGLAVRRIANMPVEDLMVLKSEEEYIERFRSLLEQAVRDRLPDVDTTIFLSGGLDSTTVAAVAVALRGAAGPLARSELRAYSVDFQPLFDDQESAIASRFAAKLGIPCQVSHMGDELPFGGWDEFPATIPEPPVDPYAVLALSYPRKAAETSRVVLSGTGSDEVLRHQAMPYLRFLAKEGRPGAAVSAVARYVFSQGKLPPLGAGIRTGFRNLFFGKPASFHFYPPWFAPDFERRLSMRDRWRAIEAPPPESHPFNSRAYNLVNDLSVSSVLEPVDPTWTACPVEFRYPFLDRRLARFLLRIPPVPWAMEKFLLRRSQIGILPDEIRKRRKTPVLHDVLELHVRSGRWNRSHIGTPAPVLRELVDWPTLMNSLQQTPDVSLYVHLRPIALSRWIENTRIS